MPGLELLSATATVTALVLREFLQHNIYYILYSRLTVQYRVIIIIKM